jgi:hypothetical protein
MNHVNHHIPFRLSYEGPSEAREGGGSGPKDLRVGSRTSWGILPQTPVLLLSSARCRMYSSVTGLYLIYFEYGQVLRTCV